MEAALIELVQAAKTLVYGLASITSATTIYILVRTFRG